MLEINCPDELDCCRVPGALGGEVPALYDDIEDRIDALLARTLDLLEHHPNDTDEPLTPKHLLSQQQGRDTR